MLEPRNRVAGHSTQDAESDKLPKTPCSSPTAAAFPICCPCSPVLSQSLPDGVNRRHKTQHGPYPRPASGSPSAHLFQSSTAGAAGSRIRTETCLRRQRACIRYCSRPLGQRRPALPTFIPPRLPLRPRPRLRHERGRRGRRWWRKCRKERCGRWGAGTRDKRRGVAGRSQAIGSPHLRPGCRQRQHVPRHVRNTYVSAWSPSDIWGRTDFSHRR